MSQMINNEYTSGPGPTSSTMLRNSSGRLKAKRYLLTWSQTEEAMDLDFMTRYFQCLPETTYKVYCQESHKDGGKHIHALLVFKETLNTRNMDYFDIGVNESHIKYHPNIKTLKSDKDVNNAIAYVKKDGNWREEGMRPSLIANLKRKEKYDLVRSSTLSQCIESGMFSFSEVRTIPLIKTMMLPQWPTWQKRLVEWYYGPTGSGKSRCAVEKMQILQDNWVILSGDLRSFMNGYEGQTGVIFDDLRPGSMRFEALLRLLDGYPAIVNVKGGSCPWLAKHIIVTAPTQPSDMYVTRTEIGEVREWDHLDQLLRRIDNLVEFPQDTQE